MNSSTERNGPKVASINGFDEDDDFKGSLCSHINYFYQMRKHFRVDSCGIRAQNRSPQVT